MASPEASFSFSSRPTLLVELCCEGSQGPSYLPGEHLGVFPANQPALVQGILERVVDGPAPHQPVRLETLSENGEPSAREPKLRWAAASSHQPPALLMGLARPGPVLQKGS